MVSLLKETIIRSSQINLTEEQLTDLQNRDVLDNQFVFFTELLEKVQELSVTFEASESDWVYLLKKAEKNLKEELEKILKFYERFFPDRITVGDFCDPETPDIIVVLGANPPLAEQRASYAGVLAKKYPDIPVVVSGGGFNVEETEAKRMYKVLLSKDISPARIILEDDSMDTIGNAFFTKLELKRSHLLKDGLRVLVVTSKFHASRSLNYFRRVFSSRYRVAVNCIVTLNEKDRIRIARHELLTEYKAQNSVFIFNTGENIKYEGNQENQLLQSSGKQDLIKQNLVYHSLDDQTLLFQLLTKHDLYKIRVDLWRKFFPLSFNEEAEEKIKLDSSLSSIVQTGDFPSLAEKPLTI